jgi:hypothetical protein
MFQILNLPIGLRIKEENMLIFTVTPGPCAPSSMYGIMDFIVSELEELNMNGFEFKGLKFKVKLGLVVADLPAVRKVLGFSFCKCKFLYRKLDDDDNFNSRNAVNPTIIKKAHRIIKSVSNSAETFLSAEMELSMLDFSCAHEKMYIECGSSFF